MFLNTVGHNLKNRLVATNFSRSGETVSRYFNKVLHAVVELRNEFIRPPSSSTPTKICWRHICCCNFIMGHCKCCIFMYELIYYLLKFCVTVL